ncbi:MAG: thioredoxin family protein [Candidatus Zixiibacteriota bacterium]|nr:MAG: thioredoxin family protein [candidate division Zixibacteria bacterium]
MKLIQILGTGCPKCRKLEENTKLAAKQMALECEVLKVTDINAIMHMGVMMTPALAIDGKVKVTGKVPSVDELKIILAED